MAKSVCGITSHVQYPQGAGEMPLLLLALLQQCGTQSIKIGEDPLVGLFHRGSNLLLGGVLPSRLVGVGFTLGPGGAAVLLGLSVGAIAATAVWAAPAARFLVAFQED